MAKSISEEELQLRKRARRRLIGAVALVTSVAVFLPMALEHEPRSVDQDISIQIPAPNSGAFAPRLPPVPDAKSAARPASEPAAKSGKAGGRDAPRPAAAPAVKPAAGAAAPPKKPAAAPPKAHATPAAGPKSAPAAPIAAGQARPAAENAGSFVVQVAALNDDDKAKQMQERIAAAGVKSYTEVVPTVKGNVTRVRAGPFASRGEAEKVRAQLQGIGLNGNIVPQ